MIPLAGSDFPKTDDQFRRALGEGLKIFGAPKGIVEIAGAFPNYSSLKIDFTGGSIDTRAQPPGRGIREKQAGVGIASLEISGAPFLCCGAAVNFHFTADGARLDFARDANGKPLLMPNAARAGEIDAQISRADLQVLVHAIAQAAAAKHGATIESADLSLTPLGPREIGFEANVSVSMFMKTTVRVQGWVEIDDALNATFSRLTCEAGGMIGTMAAGFIRPQLAKLQERPFPLASLPFGGVKLRDLKIDAGDPLRLQAWFAEGE